MRIFFTCEEIDVIADCMEFFQTPIDINGQSITCYPMLYSLSSEDSYLSNYSETEIRSAIAQVELLPVS